MLTYSIPTTILTQKKYHKIQPLTIMAILPKIPLNRHTARSPSLWRFCPSTPLQYARRRSFFYFSRHIQKGDKTGK
jgi:hypothetical protein